MPCVASRVVRACVRRNASHSDPVDCEVPPDAGHAEAGQAEAGQADAG